jgi:hypothetical protein
MPSGIAMNSSAEARVEGGVVRRRLERIAAERVLMSVRISS